MQNAPGRVGPGTGVPKSTGYRVGYGTGVLTSTGYRFRDRDRTGTGGLVKKSGRDPTGSYTTTVHFLHAIFRKNAYMQKLRRCIHLYLSVCFTLFTTNFTCPQFHEANPAFSKGFEFAKVRKVVDEEGKGAWRGEASRRSRKLMDMLDG